MESEDRLHREVETPRSESGAEEWLRRHALSVSCCVVGIIAFLVTAGIQLGKGEAFFELPNLWMTVPMLLVTVGLGVASFYRRERGLVPVIIGCAFAATSVALGYFVAALIAILIVSVAAVILKEAL
jgi:cytochrome bd-type quinol oxidase subunit 2